MPQDINLDNVNGLAAMEPFGAENLLQFMGAMLGKSDDNTSALVKSIQRSSFPLHLEAIGDIPYFPCT